MSGIRSVPRLSAGVCLLAVLAVGRPAASQVVARSDPSAAGVAAGIEAGEVDAVREGGQGAAGEGGAVAAGALPELEETLVDLQVGRLARQTVRALTDGQEVFVPVTDFLTMGEVEYVVDDRGAVRAVLHPGARLVVVEPDAREATVAGTVVPIDPLSLAVDQGTLYVATPLLERLFDLTIRTDWTQLTVVIMDPEGLPVGRRLAREARWRNLRAESAEGASDYRVSLDERPFGGAVADWSFASDAADPAGTTSYAVGAGARVWGGGLQLSARSLGAASLGQHQVDVTYQQVWRDRTWIQQMRLGDGFVTGPRYRSLRGVSVSNAPFLRRSYFGTDGFSGRVGPGWDVELRQSGQTIDLTRADEEGAFALDIPLRYGENAVQVVAFGPHGEVVTSERLFLLGSERLPAGELEWGLSGGACRDERCTLTGNVDLRYGASNRWTFRAGTEAFGRDSAASLVQPYVGVTGMVVPGLELSAEALRLGFLRGGATYAPSPRLRLRTAYTAFSRGIADPVLHDARRRATTEADALVRPLASRPRWLVRGSLLRQELESGVLSLTQASSMFPIADVRVEVGVRREVNTPVLGPRFARNYQFGAVTGLAPLPGRRKVWIRGEMEWLGASSLERVRGRVGYQLGSFSRVEVGSGWSRSVGADFTVGLNVQFGGLRSLTQVSGQRGAPARVTQVAHGTVHWNDATGGVSFSPGPGVERGGIAGYVFVDENGNGALDPFERGLDGVRVVIGGRTVRTDEMGRHLAWDLVPYEPVRVWADSTSIGDPTLVPVRTEVEVLVPPASFGRLDIAVTPSVELAGRVVRVTPDGDVPVAHAELELWDPRAGEGRSIRTFSDGEFYELGVKPGSYELRVAPGSLDGLGLLPEHDVYPVEVRLGADGPEPVTVRLLRAGGAPGAGL
jgi:hypothetical protein